MYTTKSNNKNCNYIVNQTVSWKMMSIDQCEEVFLTAAELLERTGICIESKAAVELFAANGFWTEGSTVRFPSTKIEWALKAAPSRITICNRYGKRAMRLETQNVHFGPAGGAEKVVDRKTGEPRKMTISDVEETARLSEVLDNVDFASAPGTPDADGVSVLHSLEALLKYTTKPIMQPVVCGKHAEAAIAMAAAAVGGAAKLRMNPYLVLSVESAEPRYISAETADVITSAAKNGVPIIFNNKLVSGDTAPATTAGTLVVALANTIAAIALAQTVSEGTPVIAGGFFTAIDTENNIAPYGSPEAALISAGFSNLMNYLKIPTASVAGISNSAASDAQVGVEMTIGTLTTALAGTNMLSAG
ncbi:MAG: trimethylamine methyltransferase family protein, partial [Synergistaceae bacterium]|nr:trimethylamine methyltransferase family protein [Synergistaceae bacterium]